MTTRIASIQGLGSNAKVFTTIVESVTVQMIDNKTFRNREDHVVQSDDPLSVGYPDVREGIPDSTLPTGIPTEVVQKMNVLLINPQDHSVGQFATNHEPATASTHMIA